MTRTARGAGCLGPAHAGLDFVRDGQAAGEVAQGPLFEHPAQNASHFSGAGRSEAKAGVRLQVLS